MSSDRSAFQTTSRSIPWLCFTVRREKPSSALLCCRIQPRQKPGQQKRVAELVISCYVFVTNALFVTVEVLVFLIHYRLTIFFTLLWLQDSHPWLVPRGFPATLYVLLYQAVKSVIVFPAKQISRITRRDGTALLLIRVSRKTRYSFCQFIFSLVEAHTQSRMEMILSWIRMVLSLSFRIRFRTLYVLTTWKISSMNLPSHPSVLDLVILAVRREAN